MEDLISKAEVLLEALPYIQRFRSETFVVKYGGSFMDSPDPEVRNSVARDIVFLEAVGINPVVVHGGGKAITRAMEAPGSRRTSSRASASPMKRPSKSSIRCSRARSIRKWWQTINEPWRQGKRFRRHRHFHLPQILRSPVLLARKSTSASSAKSPV